MLLVQSVAVLVGLYTDAGQTPVAPPPREVAITNVGTYYGEVMALDSRSITIRGKEEQNLPVETVIRTFPVGWALRKGEQEPKEKSPSDYRLTDVKVGDIVYIMIHVFGEEHQCVAVRIKRRPGGTVPKAPFEPGDAAHGYNEMMNAYQQFEEKGIPLPLKYNQDFQRAVRDAQAVEFKKNLDRLYHEDKMQHEGRIAPPPRPVSRK